MTIYLDNAATTPLDPRVLKKMLPYFSEKFANPASIHALGQDAFITLEGAREKVANILNAPIDSIVFTSGATEANNLIIKGLAEANKNENKKRIIISAIEHPCVREAAKRLTTLGYTIDYLPANKQGIVTPKALENLMNDDVLLVSVMMVNNEIGTISDIKKLASVAHRFGAYFHSDAVQAVPYLNIDIKALKVDFLTLSAHKFYGPKGVGLAYINPKIKINALILGGGQENNIRSGTHNLPGIIGLSEALYLAYKERDKYLKKISKLQIYFWEKLKKEIPEILLNGSWEKRVPANLNVLFRYIEGEAILMDLSQKGICVSTGSACSASDLRASYVLKEIGLDKNYLNSNIRFSLGRYTTKAELDYTVKALKETVKRLRAFSPIT
ncbi:MAG: cysteine desulfurase family protein [Patescibacteria group bacterium]|nr:cysteine desulfurase family protein [Patescibacteria group bacterium]MDD3777910.1 cysteine desulfurase family protein [Patescibacteria group bacterium]MDD3939385.1 cysteine desulfurase family protein [Patescibacteria group bacterium]MDD4443747.1 cysteine desulfurase family protein [Patescibacteria group bacterium]